MKRFNCTVFNRRGVDGSCMEPCIIGDYVKYSVASKRIAELEVIAKAVAHIGVDFGYGVYEIENKHIEDARQYFLTKDGNL